MEKDEFALSSEALSALRDVLLQGEDDQALEGLIQARLALHQEPEEDSSEEEEEFSPTETHAEYYSRLFPYRYQSNESRKDEGSTRPAGDELVARVTVDDEYVRDIIVERLEKMGNWKVVTDSINTVADEAENGVSCREENAPRYDLHWGEYEHIDWFSPMLQSGNTVVSCYYCRKGLSRKINLGYILEKWKAKHGSAVSTLSPKTFILEFPNEIFQGERFEVVFDQIYKSLNFSGFGDGDNWESRDVVDDGNVWILKPSVTNQANGIHLVRSQKQLKEAISSSDDVAMAGGFVLQKYLPPLLLDNRKFHIRAFMLLIGDICAFVSPKLLAIFSLERYAAADLDATQAHLTNIAHQQILSLEDQHRCMRLFEETKEDMIRSGLVETLDEAEEKVKLVTDRVMTSCRETVKAVSSELTFEARDNNFELFGLDFHVDPDWNVWLLEANAEPDLSKAGDRLQPVIDEIIKETLELVVEHNWQHGSSVLNCPRSMVEVYRRSRSQA